MKNLTMVTGILMSLLAAIISVVFAVVVINGEWIMFDKRNMNDLVLTLMIPAVIQILFYVVWFTKQNNSMARNADKLAKGSFLVCICSVLTVIVVLLCLSFIFDLLEEGSMFLIVSGAAYIVLCVIQYICFRPY